MWRDVVRCPEDISQQRCSPEAKHLTVTLFLFYFFVFSGRMRCIQCRCLFPKFRGPLSFLVLIFRVSDMFMHDFTEWGQ